MNYERNKKGARFFETQCSHRFTPKGCNFIGVSVVSCKINCLQRVTKA